MLASVRASLSLLSGRQRATYFFLIGTKVLSSFLDLLGIAVIGLLVGLATTSLTSGHPFVVLGFTLPTMTATTLVAIAAFALVLFLAKGVLAILLSRRLAHFLAGLDLENANRITRYFLSGNLSTIQKYSRESINWAVLDSTASAFSATLLNFATAISESSLLVFIGAMFFFVNPLATAFTLTYFAVLIVSMELVVGRMSKRAGQKYSRGVRVASGALNDIQNTFREISVFQRQEYFAARVAGGRADVADGFGTMKLLQTMPRYIVETALMVGVVGFLGWQFLSGGLQNGGGALIGIFLAGGVRIMGSALPLQNALASLKNQLGQAQEAQQILEEMQRRERSGAVQDSLVATVTESEAAQDHSVAPGALGLSLENVDFAYPDSDELTLRGVSLVVEPGQHVAVIGPSGAGKTTLIDLILGLLPPSGGSVTIAGMPPAQVNKLHPGLISYVPQKPGIVAGTIAQNIALGIPAEDIDFSRIDEVVGQAFLADFIAGLPDGVHSSVGAQLSGLSGGQIQRLGLARALYPRPKLLILDEATSALDAGSESVVSQSLRELGGSVTVIIVAHRLSTVQHSDNVFVLEGGRVSASGTFQKLRKTVPLIEEYVSLMSFDADEGVPPDLGLDQSPRTQM